MVACAAFILLFYHTHGSSVLFGSPIFKITTSNMAQKRRAAEVILHGIYSVSSWFQYSPLHEEQSSDSQDPAEKFYKLTASSGC